jgi:hypothetical protein
MVWIAARHGRRKEGQKMSWIDGIGGIHVGNLSEKLGPPKNTASDQLRYNCYNPNCGGKGPDTKYHLYVDPVKGVWFCHRCQRGGNLETLLRNLGVDVDDVPVSKFNQESFFDFPSMKSRPNVIRPVQMPEDYTEIRRGMEAYAYLQQRGIGEAEIERYRIGFGTQNMRKVDRDQQYRFAGWGRIIFPDYNMLRKLIYWVARTYKGHKIKYRNAQVPSRDIIYNFARTQREGYDQAIICEGPISAIRAGKNGIATYGKYVTAGQRELLARASFGEYVIAFDGDARKDTVKLAKFLAERGKSVRVVYFAFDEDPASVDDFSERVKNARIWDPYEDLVFLLDELV